MKFLFKLYLASFAFFAFANFGGYIPLSTYFISILFIIFCLKILYSDKIFFLKLDIADKFLLAFIFISVISFIFSSRDDLNFNHIFSHLFVFSFFYFFVKFYLLNSIKLNFAETISNYVSIVFYLIIITSIIDYLFFGFGINLANVLPLATRNIVFGESWGVRARGFFVEPTDLALALNVYGTLFIGFKYFFNKKKEALIGGVLYIVVLLLTRSSSGFFEIFASLIVIFFWVLLFPQNRSFIISFRIVKQLFAFTIVLFVLYIIFADTFNLTMLEFSRKFDFINSNFEGGDVRVEYWVEAVSLIKSFDLYEILFGIGTGFTSWNLKTFNWYLTIFIENGVIGVLFIFIFFFLKIIKCFSIISNLKFFYFIAIFSIFLHLFSQVGYFYPYVWLPIATLDLFFVRFSNNKL